MLKAIWGFLYEYLIGKDVRFKTAIREHKRKLVLLILLFIALFFDYRLAKQVIAYHKVEQACLTKSEEQKEEIRKLNHEIDQLRETNLVLVKKLGTDVFSIDDIDELNNTQPTK
jgi:predicted RND superfamily exporter protein